MFNGNVLMRSRAARSRAVTKVTPSPATPCWRAISNSTCTRGSVVWTRCPRPGSAGALLDGPLDGASRGILDADAVAAGLCDGVIDEHHAAFAGAAVIVADRENAGGDRRRERLAVPGCRQSGGGARRRAGAVVGDADQDGIEQLRSPALGSRPRCSRKIVSVNGRASAR